METEEALRELTGRLDLYPAENYPVQHGIARFHLGVALANLNRYAEAEESLESATRLLELLPVEGAKALNAQGAVLRALGRHDEATSAFTAAAAAFESAGLELERGAAAFNLGLVRREAGNPRAAGDAFRLARSLLDEARVPAQAAAASRELGATLLDLGELDDAVATLEEAQDRAERALDHVELGGSANLLGLAHLARGDAHTATVAFTTAAGSHPRTVRPREFAMAKANLALAHELEDDGPRARLAARQALAVRDADAPVRAQATAALERLGPCGDDLLRVLDETPADAVQRLLREELVRGAGAGADERRRDAEVWIDGLLARPERTAELAEAWIGALLELPPEAMEATIRSTLEALLPRERDEVERFRDELRMAAARFHAPQMLRIEGTFDRTASELALPWS